MVDEAVDNWKRVAQFLHERLDQLMPSASELEQSSGVSSKTWKRVLDGEPITRRDKRRQIAVAVGWTPDSIDRVLAGGEPQTASQPASVVDDLRRALENVNRELAALREDVKQLLPPQDGSAPPRKPSHSDQS